MIEFCVNNHFSIVVSEFEGGNYMKDVTIDKIRETLQNGDYVVVNTQTGEAITEEVRVVSLAADEKRRETAKKEAEKKRRQELAQATGGNKRFIFHIYHVCVNTFPEMQPANLTRLMFLATHITYNNVLVDKKNKPLSKPQIQKLMKLNKTQFYDFWNEMEKFQIIKETNQGIAINDELFFKGSITPELFGSNPLDAPVITRLYIKGVQELYKKATPASHKSLSYIFRILPFVNRRYNVVCFNPLEEDADLVQPMTLLDFADTIGYSRNNIKRLMRTLQESTFEVNGHETKAVGFANINSFATEDSKIFINPRVYYGGDFIEDADILKILTK